jgi:hypothetical protein
MHNYLAKVSKTKWGSEAGQRQHAARVVRLQLSPHPAVVQRRAAPHAAKVGAPAQRRSPHVAQPLFDDDVFLTADSEEVECDYDYDEFWTLLQRPKKEWDFDAINLQVKLTTTFKTGPLAISARRDTPHSFLLEVASDTNRKQSVLWLPWLHGNVAVANRSDYERAGSKIDYFFTAGLDGCTFLLTETAVMHVAADYAKGVAHAAQGHTVVAQFRPADYQPTLTNRGFVFGVRSGSSWYYYLCSGHFTKNCSSVVLASPPSVPYGGRHHFTLM